MAVRTREERSSTKVGAGAAVATATAATTGSNPRHQRKGLIGPPHADASVDRAGDGGAVGP
eukprot:6576827-Alexandrium_andersonii.AAC.1